MFSTNKRQFMISGICNQYQMPIATQSAYKTLVLSLVALAQAQVVLFFFLQTKQDQLHLVLKSYDGYRNRMRQKNIARSYLYSRHSTLGISHTI